MAGSVRVVSAVETGPANKRSAAMHYIADDLDGQAWVNAGLARLEHYLACWRLFTDLYPTDAG
jgi:hypothetical protein